MRKRSEEDTGKNDGYIYIIISCFFFSKKPKGISHANFCAGHFSASQRESVRERERERERGSERGSERERERQRERGSERERE